jgi:hypothetical protein
MDQLISAKLVSKLSSPNQPAQSCYVLAKLNISFLVVICGPVHYWWMYPVERYMKTLKDYVRTYVRPKASMAEDYVMSETLGYSKEYICSNSRKHLIVYGMIRKSSL